MDKDTIRQVLLLAVSSIVLYFSGIYLMSLGKLKSVEDGFIVMIFFFAFFPFLSVFTKLTFKAFRAFIGAKNYQ
ncbi:hypothetical protein BW723_17170 [Polaribacter reichenbachii]|uniref:Uncharacterized protein n=1 Tax=Polaribacter reichenbachii TaxID=996801 RepID=A0A1B8U457_9FLAO|nr:hypothetical protein [Polaribacter reichenbachii]APZ47920.1 hypothetical protein BW723_17170 [Polaribacter reichenbachii]AUC18552.1 hypothetical protein BTO17_07565 [Polaribacter reichenbachii]OBY66622.1 hypothetical protein LPB301_06390 [Polaribacter reichenbachii]